MASYEQTFLEQITHLHGQDFSSWQGWQSTDGLGQTPALEAGIFRRGKDPGPYAPSVDAGN